MEHIARQIWRKLPLSIRSKHRSNAIKFLEIVFTLFGIQFQRQSIGKANVPYLAKAKLKRSFAQQGEDLILDRIMTMVLGWDVTRKRQYVDVGAYDAITHSVTDLLYLRGWKGVVFDPSIVTQKSFQRWRKRDHFVRAVVGMQDNVKVDFYIPKRAGNDQSLVSTKYPRISEKNQFTKVKFNQVNLNEALKRNGIEKVHFLNLDVEGAELEVLSTFDFKYFKPSVIAVEIFGDDLEACLHSDVAKLILKEGYQFSGSAVITQFFVRKDEIISIN